MSLFKKAIDMLFKTSCDAELMFAFVYYENEG